MDRDDAVTLNREHLKRMGEVDSKLTEEEQKHLDDLDDDQSEFLAYTMYNLGQIGLVGGNILDIGAGNAFRRDLLLEVFKGTYTGIEMIPEVAFAGRRKGIVHGFIEDLSESRLGPFEWGFAYHVMEHVRNPRRALEAVHAVLVPGGTYGQATPAEIPDDEPAHITELHSYEWAALLEECGFEVLFSGIHLKSSIVVGRAK